MAITKSGYQAILFCMLFLATNFVNKYVLSILEFKYPTIFQGWQTFVGFITLRILISSHYIDPVLTQQRAKYEVAAWLPGMFFFVISIYSGSRALANLPIPVFFSLHNLTIVVSCTLQIAFTKQLTSIYSYCMMMLLIISSFGVVSSDPQFNAEGYFWMVIHILALGALDIYTELMKGRLKLSFHEKLYSNYIYSFVILAPSSYFIGIILNDFVEVIYEDSFFGSLSMFLQSHLKPKPIYLKHLLIATKQLANGIQFMQKRDLCHGNLCCKNIVVTRFEAEVFRVKISDDDMVSFCNTLPLDEEINKKRLPWVDVEVYEKSDPLLRLSQDGDIYAFGTTLWEMFSHGISPLHSEPWTKLSFQEAKKFFSDYKEWPIPLILRDMKKRSNDLDENEKEEFHLLIETINTLIRDCHRSGNDECSTLPSPQEILKRLDGKFGNIEYCIGYSPPVEAEVPVNNDQSPDKAEDVHPAISRQRQRTLSEFIKISDLSINKESPLGEGEFGKVFKGVYTAAASGERIKVAVKQPKRDMVTHATEHWKEWTYESDILRELDNPNIVKYIGLCRTEKLIVMELVEGPSLYVYLVKCSEQSSRPGDEKMNKICNDIAKGMCYLWEQTNDATGLTIQNPDRAVATATGTIHAGNYEFKLTVTDNENLKSTSKLIIHVMQHENNPPIANAGGDKTVVMPNKLVTLDGTKSTDDHGITKYFWKRDPRSLVAGDVVNGSDHHAVLQIVNMVAGHYTFILTVVDSEGLMDSDQASVIVKEDPHRDDLMELFIDADIKHFTEENKKNLAGQLGLLLPKSRLDGDVSVDIQDIEEDRTTGHLRVTFYAVDSSKDFRSVRNGDETIRILRKKLADSSILDYKVLLADTVVCHNNCSGHGRCDPLTKQCICQAFWMEDTISKKMFKGESNCDWSILYVIIVSFITVFAIGIIIFTTIYCCKRKRCRCRWKNKKRHRYSLLKEIDDDQDDMEMLPKAKIHNSSVMISESDFSSEEETLFVNSKKSNGHIKPINGISKQHMRPKMKA
ncbi:hypothetical protein ScPMuIL_007501 [Solemya velum]